MTDPKFPKLLDYEALKQQFGEDKPPSTIQNELTKTDNLSFEAEDSLFADPVKETKPGLKGTRLRSYAFAVLTRKEFSKAELIEKLALYAEDRNEVITLVKDTSLVYSVSYIEMFALAKQIAAAQTTVVPFVIAGVFYYIFNFVVAWVMEWFEKKLNYYH